MKGEAPVPFTKDPAGKNRQDVRVADPSTPVTIQVLPKPAQ